MRQALSILGANTPDQWLTPPNGMATSFDLVLTKSLIQPSDHRLKRVVPVVLGECSGRHESESFTYHDDDQVKNV